MDAILMLNCLSILLLSAKQLLKNMLDGARLSERPEIFSRAGDDYLNLQTGAILS